MNGKKEGFGTYIWPDGKRYEGKWKNGVQHGEGKVTLPTGETLFGVWNNGAPPAY